MRVRVRNLGVLKDAEFELSNLTILCGENNTGKTYATYTLYGFLATWHHMLKTSIKDVVIANLMNRGIEKIDVEKHIEEIDSILKKGCADYTKRLPRIFASSTDKFANAQFSISIDKNNICPAKQFKREIHIGESIRISISNSEKHSVLKISLARMSGKNEVPQGLIKKVISETVIKMLFDSVFPKTFIASAERTGAAIFRKELDFARNRLLEKMSAEEKINPMELLYNAYQDYPLPVTHNVDFTREIESISKSNSFLAKKHPDVLNDFANIIGGEYIITKNQGVLYKPKGRHARLSMGESSSAVRSLLDIGFYLRHIAQRDDLLMIDEPELNLHPENQRRMARLFVRLVNLGMKVFITTHSDYIIKELNTLIMLKRDMPHLKKIVKQGKYKDEELLSSDKVKLYTAEKALVKLENNKRRTRRHTLVPAKITRERGIEALSFDKTINEMNEVEEAILWGGEI